MQFTINIRSKLIIKGYKSEIKVNDSVLDIGCGTGIVAKNIEDAFDCKISGADIQNYLDYDIHFYKINTDGKLPTKTKSFDIAMINDVLHHCDKGIQIKVIKEALRVSKKVLIFETRPTLIAFFIDKVLNWVHNKNMPVPLTHRSIKNWMNLLESNGIKPVLIKLKTPFYYPLSHFVFIIKSKK